LCRPTAAGYQFIEAAISASRRFLSSSQPSKALERMEATLFRDKCLLSDLDAAERVRSMPPTRNNRINETFFLNRFCAFDAGFESTLLGDPSQNHFSTVLVISDRAILRQNPAMSAIALGRVKTPTLAVRIG
jgi:hypothetical protein